MDYATFSLNGETVYTEEVSAYPQNIRFLCELCGAAFAEARFADNRKWRFITSHCAECDPRWGGSFFDLPDRALHAALPRRILEIELKLEINRGF